MSKRILLLLVALMITMQTNFAMKPEGSPTNLTSSMRGRFTKDLIITKLSPMYHAEKKSQNLKNQLHEFESHKNDLKRDNSQIMQGINQVDNCVSRNMLWALITNPVISKTVSVFGPLVCIEGVIDHNDLQNRIRYCELKLNENFEQVVRINRDEAKMKFKLIQLNERKNTLKKINVRDNKAKVTVCFYVQGSEKKAIKFDFPIHASVTLSSIEPLSICLAQTPTNQSLRNSIFSLSNQGKPLCHKAQRFFTLKHKYQIDSLIETIEFFMRLKSTCKEFYIFITHDKIVDFIKKYKQKYKDLALKFVMSKKIITNDNQFCCIPELILLRAGANPIAFKKLIIDEQPEPICIVIVDAEYFKKTWNQAKRLNV